MNQEIIKIIQTLFSTNSMIPLHAPIFVGNEKTYLNDCIDSTYVSSVGPYVDKVEDAFGTYFGIKKTVAIVNGTAALQLALKIVGVEPEDEVITQSLTFVATANAISHLGAHPIFIDVDLETMSMSPDAFENFLNQNADMVNGECINRKTKRRIKACVPMHTFGFPANMVRILSIAKSWNLKIVEDAAEALGSFYNDEPCGIIGDIGVLSFNGNKIITSGGGGIIVSKNQEYIDRAKYLSTTAKIPHPYEFMHDEIAFNFRMPNLNAAVLLAQFEKLDLFLQKKRELAVHYHELFNQIGVKHRMELPHTKANYWLNCIEMDSFENRNMFLDEANSMGVICRPIWTPMHKLPMYLQCQRDEMLNTERLEKSIVNIPSSVIL
jgi:perosamine synthetase